MMDRCGLLTGIVVAMACGAILTGCGFMGDPSEMVTDPNAARTAARRALYLAAESPEGAVRAPALESLSVAEGPAAGPALLRGLDAPTVAVRFVAAMGIGDTRYMPAITKLRQISNAPTTNANVQCGVIYALHRLGDDTHMSQLGRLLYVPSAEIRANAALVMGKVGMAVAIAPLRSRLDIERDPGVRLQLAESLALLGENRSSGMLTNYTRIGEPHERLAAVQALGRTRSLRARSVILWAIQDERHPPMRLVAAGALARMGDNRGYGIAIEAVRDPRRFAQRSYDQPVSMTAPQMQQIQSLGAMALAEMGYLGAVDELVGLLDSPNPIVVVSASRSILVLLGPEAPKPAETPVEPPTVEAPPVEAPPVEPAAAAAGEAAGEAPATQPSSSPASDVLRTAPMRD